MVQMVNDLFIVVGLELGPEDGKVSTPSKILATAFRRAIDTQRRNTKRNRLEGYQMTYCA